MKRLRCILLGLCLGLAAVGAARPVLGQQSGTLMFDLKNYTADAKMPKKSQKQLEHAGIQWGMLDNSVLISLVNRSFVKADMPYLTRFGEQKTLDLKPGHYTITCIGIEFKSTSTDVNRALAKSAFFNNDVLEFTVLPGKTTTLEITPVYVTESQWRLWVKLNFFMPELKVRVLEDGTPKGDGLVITQRTAKSLAWNDYHGPLKF